MQEDMTAFKREFTPYIRRCGELEGVLSEFSKAMEVQRIHIVPASPAKYEAWVRETLASRTDRSSLLDIVESAVQERHRVYRQSVSMRDEFAPALYGLIEQRETVAKATQLFQFDLGGMEHEELEGGEDTGMSLSQMDALMAGGGSQGVGLGASAPAAPAHGSAMDSGALAVGDGEFESEYRFRHLAGVVPTAEVPRFERLVVRTSKRQAYVRFADITDKDLMDEGRNPIKKTVFLIFYRLPSLEKRLERLCDSFGKKYDIPRFNAATSSRAAVRRSIQGLESEIRQQLHTLRAWRVTLAAELRQVAQEWDLHRQAVQRAKATYAALNLFTRSSAEMLTVRGWVRKVDVPVVEDVLLRVNTPVGGGAPLTYLHRAVPAPWPKEPTHFQTTDFTKGFQVMVDTFGIPRYREINPALFTAITFPFMFGMMYGDVGHSSVLLCAGLFMLWNEAKLKRAELGDILGMAFSGRYMLVLMASFGIYCGLMYNDFFGLSLELAPSTWEFPCDNCTVAERVAHGGSRVPPFGADPIWHITTNELGYYNSLKMKMSVVFGVVHMTFGLVLRAMNDAYFGDWLTFWTETVPQFIFLQSLFGYMVLLILMKWAIDWSVPGAGQPPNLIDQMIGIVLTPGTVAEPMYEGQAGVQVFLLLLAFVCVPWMLFAKPCLQWRWATQAQAGPAFARLHEGETRELLSDTSSEASGPASSLGLRAGVGAGDVHGGYVAAPAEAAGPVGDAGHGHGEFDFTDAMVHSGIETIEFVLGGVSNTASYLRLWALSLAHSELAAVFWERAFQATLDSGNFVMIFVGYGAFAGATMGVLLLMDVLECVLHALRLHWVEFQSKFYKADGYNFAPLDLGQVVRETAPRLSLTTDGQPQ